MHRELARRVLIAPLALTFALSGCAVLQSDPHLAAFSSQLTGMNQLPPVATPATGHLDSVLNKNTGLLRWQLSYTGLSGAATAGHFHGPAAIGVNASPALPLSGPLRSPVRGQATLTAAQVNALLSGQWYINIHTAAHPAGEIRGQVRLVE